MTEDDRLFLKHIGNSIHTFVAENAAGRAAWSPDQRFIAFSRIQSSSEWGTCIAAANLGSENPPAILSPCPISGTGTDPVWSADGNNLLTVNYSSRDPSGELILSGAPADSSRPMRFEHDPRVILRPAMKSQSSVWIGPN
ncbi:MAG: hypothetical protein JW929_02125 [Anaerolineales bacterium]|nr:hypothetical protein [Anaerolineales bacterium]